jgi:hypothetical protein
MRRSIGLLISLLLLSVLAVPGVLAADGANQGWVLLSFNGDADVASGQQADAVIVVDGNASVAGQVGTVVVTGGDATIDGTVDTVAVIDGTLTLGDSARVTGDVWTLNATVDQAPGATVGGEVRGLESSLAALGFVLVPAFLLFLIGLALVTVVAAVVLALIAARQVRTAEALITREPLLVFVIGLIGAFLLPLAAVVAMFTVVGAPLGLAFLLMVLPAIAYAGWIVAAIWIGDWILSRSRSAPPPERPVLAAIIGVIVLGLIGLIPFVSAIASAFGFGALLLYAWRLLIEHPVVPAPAPAVTAPPSSPV